MEHQGTVTLETPRLTLRRFRLVDAEAAFRNWMGSEEVHCFLCGPAHRDASVTRRVLSDWAVRYDRPDFYQWPLCTGRWGSRWEASPPPTLTSGSGWRALATASACPGRAGGI